MTEREFTKLASELFDEGFRAADTEAVAEKTKLSGAELEKIMDLITYYAQQEFLEH